MRQEDALQKAVAALLDHSGLIWSATANGAFLQGNAQQRAIRGMRMKQHGVKNGLPDILIFEPEGLFSVSKRNGFGDRKAGLAIELKTGKNKPTPAQLEWRDKLVSCGWLWVVAYSVDDVLAVLRECYPGRVK
jgi:hypothetical protein